MLDSGDGKMMFRPSAEASAEETTRRLQRAIRDGVPVPIPGAREPGRPRPEDAAVLSERAPQQQPRVPDAEVVNGSLHR